MDDQQTAALIAALALAAVHLFAPRLRFLTLVPRTSWLSAAGGISVAYVFVHLLPELAEGQAAIEGEQAGPAPPLEFLEHHVYLVALIGLGVFYGVEKHSLSSRRRNSQQSAEDRTSDDAFWLSIASFAVYNASIGYLLLRSELEELTQLTLYTVAIGVHFVINDVALREHHCDVYRRVGRWLISGAVLGRLDRGDCDRHLRARPRAHRRVHRWRNRPERPQRGAAARAAGAVLAVRRRRTGVHGVAAARRVTGSVVAGAGGETSRS
jgi:hypothetical protein